MLEAFNIFVRWLHVTSACMLVGGVLLLALVLPAGLALLEPEQREAVLLRCRRGFKMVLHAGLLLLILSGTYNAVRMWGLYPRGLGHGLFGVHVLLAVAGLGVLLAMFMGAALPRAWRGGLAAALGLLLLAIAAASTLKWARERVQGSGFRVQDRPLATGNAQLTARNSRLATHNSQLTTHNSQLNGPQCGPYNSQPPCPLSC